LEPVRADEWRRGEAPFASVRVDATTIIDLLESPASKASLDAGSGGKPAGGVVRNMDHLCLVVQPGDLDEVVSSGSFEVLGGPGTRFGAQGDGTAVYVSDPDGNTVELRSYG
jgi:catechol 2,3-dioxygenase-like lactoylglutathione lyase family enzyme